MVGRFKNKIYAGVLGKLIGVYLGRPVEGWSYQKIRDTFDEVKYYVHDRVKVFCGNTCKRRKSSIPDR